MAASKGIETVNNSRAVFSCSFQNRTTVGNHETYEFPRRIRCGGKAWA